MKIVRNFTIDSSINDDFSLLSKEMSINKSQFVENKFKDFISENIFKLLEIKKKLKTNDNL